MNSYLSSYLPSSPRFVTHKNMCFSCSNEHSTLLGALQLVVWLEENNFWWKIFQGSCGLGHGRMAFLFFSLSFCSPSFLKFLANKMKFMKTWSSLDLFNLAIYTRLNQSNEFSYNLSKFRQHLPCKYTIPENLSRPIYQCNPRIQLGQANNNTNNYSSNTTIFKTTQSTYNDTRTFPTSIKTLATHFLLF